MDVKEEKYSLCQGCLSSDRTRLPLGGNHSLFLQLLEDSEKYSYGVTKDLLLCWECTARLKSIRKFQKRIKNAQNILQQYIIELNSTPYPLSTLNIEVTDHYDHTINNDLTSIIKQSFNTEIKLENQVEVQLLPTINDNINDSDNQLIDDDNQLIDSDNQFIDTDNQLLDNNNQIIDNDNRLLDNDNHLMTNGMLEYSESKNNKKANNIRSIRNQVSIKKYEKYASVDQKVKMEGDLKKWYSKLKLSEKEMEDLLNKDRIEKATWKFEKKCTECDIVYRRSVDLKRHVVFHHFKTLNSLKCTQCKTKCASQSDLKKHWKSTHTCVYKCAACDVVCRDTNEIGRHVNREHGAVYTCIECGVARSTLRAFSEHYKEFHEKVVCDYCKRSFNKKSVLIKHIKYKHSPPICDVCNREMQNHKALTKHRYIVHAITVRGPQPRDLAYCVECDKQFPTIYKYKYHLSQSPRHQNKNKFMRACPECGKVFSRTACMNHHYKLVHLKDTRYKCDICNKCFAMNSRLIQHQRVVHQKIGLPKNKICDICGRGFTTNRILTEHRRTHTGERPYKCGYCDCAFAQRGAMLVHQRTQHKNVQQTN